MPYLKDYRLFISHAWKYDSTYSGLIQLLNAAPLFLIMITLRQRKNHFFHLEHLTQVLKLQTKSLQKYGPLKSLWFYRGCMELIVIGCNMKLTNLSAWENLLLVYIPGDKQMPLNMSLLMQLKWFVGILPPLSPQ